MFLGRLSVLRNVAKRDGKPRRRKSDEMIDQINATSIGAVDDVENVWESNKHVLRFRKFPWAHWIMGCLWIFGTLFVIWEIHREIGKKRKRQQVYLWAIILGTLFLGIVFVYKGNIKTTIFDRKYGTLTIKKRNLCCDKRKITTYPLKEILDVRAVYRGYASGGINTLKYYVIVEFKDTVFEGENAEDSDKTFYSSSEDEFQYQKVKERAKMETEAKDGPYKRNTKVLDETELQQMEYEEDLKNLSEKVEQKEGYRRGTYRSGYLQRLDKGIKERIGNKNEVKILETKVKTKARKQLCLIRKFLKLKETDCKIVDERDRIKVHEDKDY